MCKFWLRNIDCAACCGVNVPENRNLAFSLIDNNVNKMDEQCLQSAHSQISFEKTQRKNRTLLARQQ